MELIQRGGGGGEERIFSRYYIPDTATQAYFLFLFHLLINQNYVPETNVAYSASTMYLHMAVLIGGGNLTESQTKNFSKDCIIYAVNIDPSP